MHVKVHFENSTLNPTLNGSEKRCNMRTLRLPVLAQAAAAHYSHGGFNNRLFLTVLEQEKSEDRDSMVRSLSGLLTWFADGCLLAMSCMDGHCPQDLSTAQRPYL